MNKIVVAAAVNVCCLVSSQPLIAGWPGLCSVGIELPGSLNAVMLNGPDSSWQVVVTGLTGSGRPLDVTRGAVFTAEPAGIVAVDSTGLVTPLRDGQATLIARVDALETRLPVEVQHVEVPHQLNFVTDVAPLFTRHGCNAGGCHGKKGGQAGFELALLGFEPELDYDRLVTQDGGYRIDLEKPDESLLLLMATGSELHTGGQRFSCGSRPYNTLRRWIAQGAPREVAGSAEVQRIEVLPAERIMPPGGRQQLLVLAHLCDGSVRDVSRLTSFAANQSEMIQVSEEGLVFTGDQFGIASVMVRYQAHVDVFRATVPTENGVQESLPADSFTADQVVDLFVNQQLSQLGIPASGPCNDGAFIRRATLDIAGRLPTLEETLGFVADLHPQKDKLLIDRLLASEDYADYFAGKWALLLHNRRNDESFSAESTQAFYSWLRERLRNNVPFDHLVRGVLTATGEEIANPPIVWYRSASEDSQQVEDVAQLFLGQRIQCARCHHHPLERWSEQDYYGMAAFFSRLEINQPPISVAFTPGPARTEHPKTGLALPPTPLGTTPLDIEETHDPREALVDWMTQPANPYFARTLVNRYWKHFMGRGLVEPEDDLRKTNPATHPQLLEGLARQFVASGFDLHQLIRAICLSDAYRRERFANGINLVDGQSYSRFLPRRLNAEVLLDAIDVVTATQTSFSGTNADKRAVQLPDNLSGSYFLSVFGRPQALSACECERSTSASVAQQLHLLNSPEIMHKDRAARARSLAGDERPHEERIRELYWLALSREPAPAELTPLLQHIQNHVDDELTAYADIVWAVINTKEFQFNH